MKLIEGANYYGVNYETWLLESEDALERLNGKPLGTVALIINNDGLLIKIKKTNDEWIDI